MSEFHNLSLDDQLEVKQGIIDHLKMYIQIEIEKQEKIQLDNENLLDFSKEMIHDITHFISLHLMTSVLLFFLFYLFWFKQR